MSDKGKGSKMTKKDPHTDTPGKHGLRPDEQREEAEAAHENKKSDEK